MSKGQSLQDPFLNALRRERVPVSIYLVNGIKLQGTIESFDQFVVLLRNTVSQMVYKHAISTVVPARNVRVGPGGGYVQSADGGDDGEGGDRGNRVTCQAVRQACVTAGGAHHLDATCPSAAFRGATHPLFERSRKGENALLIQPHAGGPPDEGLLEEFADLARSAGATVARLLTARIDRPNPATLIGSGKLEEVKAAADATGADLVLVNHPLSPGQERNLEKALERRVVDRTGLILDIFAQRARSHEGKLQVELAQLHHMATRLVRGWTHLERQRGGSIGLRGPGETQLETDRRLLQKRVEQLQKRLEKVEVQRTQMRRARVRSELPRVALVGYTNAGKSTLFNALTGADAYAADQLFATLDPTVRRIDAAGRRAWCWPTPSASCATCRTNWSPRSARPCPKRARPTCCCT